MKVQVMEWIAMYKYTPVEIIDAEGCLIGYLPLSLSQSLSLHLSLPLSQSHYLSQ